MPTQRKPCKLMGLACVRMHHRWLEATHESAKGQHTTHSSVRRHRLTVSNHRLHASARSLRARAADNNDGQLGHATSEMQRLLLAASPAGLRIELKHRGRSC